MVFIDMPKRRRRITAGAGPAAPQLDVIGIEATQAIQNLSHQVRLIAQKTTVIRVYVKPRGLTANLRVRGEIVFSPAPGAPGAYVASANEIMLRSKQHPTLAKQRRDAALSLNFLLPAPPAGQMTIRLKRASAASASGDISISPNGNELQVTFTSAPILRMRVLGIRYTDPRPNPPKPFAPNPTHFDHLRSYLMRAYPIAGLEWNQTVVDAPTSFVPPFSAPLPNGSDPLWRELLAMLHQHVLTIRQADMDTGWDPRTHYYGLVSDDSGFFRGAANDVPQFPAPNTIAVGPCGGTAGFPWDDDRSYGDWYGAHELAHTFGRPHPGFCHNQSSDDPQFPHQNGRISDSGQDCIGFDVGDSTLNLPMRAYPHEDWSDFMTYCDRQWVSKYTYDGIYDRLVAEDAQFAPPVA